MFIYSEIVMHVLFGAVSLGGFVLALLIQRILVDLSMVFCFSPFREEGLFMWQVVACAIMRSRSFVTIRWVFLLD